MVGTELAVAGSVEEEEAGDGGEGGVGGGTVL